MQNKKNIIVIMPAYNAEQTVESTLRAVPLVYDEVLLCDDASRDNTFVRSEQLGITTVRHSDNRGYGANQKTLYALAFARDPDVIVMVHPDNQYDTSRIPEMIEMVRTGAADMVLGNRMETALKNKMPWWKYVGNRFLTSIQNKIFNTHLSEFHSGLRAYNAKALRRAPLQTFSDDFVFDSEVIAWFLANGHRVREVPVECYYNTDVSSVGFTRSAVYGCATLRTLIRYVCGAYNTRSKKGDL